jgi:hemoglobin
VQLQLNLIFRRRYNMNRHSMNSWLALALFVLVIGGPCQYHGRGMKEAHAHLNITQKEWDRFVTIFKGVLAKHNVPAKESQALLDIIDSTEADIVKSSAVR